MMTLIIVAVAAFAAGFVFATLFWRKNRAKEAVVDAAVDKVTKKR